MKRFLLRTTVAFIAFLFTMGGVSAQTSRSELFLTHDPWGVVMAITAMSVVFSALVLLYFIFKFSGKIFIGLAKRRERQAQRAQQKEVPAGTTVAVKKAEGSIASEEFAAIALALYQYSEDLHDLENTVLTINKVAKAYSPWSSKIYSLRQIPNKK